MRKKKSVKPGKRKMSRKKKLLFIGTPILALVALIGVFFLYQMSRSYEEPMDNLPLDGLMSDMMPKPETGVPSDYSPQENAAIAQYVLLNTEHYQTTKDGQVKANVGFINYDQSVKNTKVVDGDAIFTQALSLSSMVKVGEQKYFNKGIYLLRPATNVQSVEDCVWSDDISAMSKDTYTDRYGMMPDGLSEYLITKDTILSAEFVGEENGEYTYTYELDPDASSVYYRRQVKTLAGSEKIPLFHSVKLTVTLDKDWQPLKVTVEENYDISIPVIGMANCNGVLTEVFHDYGVATEIPDQALFQRYIDEEYDPNNLNNFDEGGDTDIMGYISQIFDTDENGKATLGIDFTLNDGTPQKAYVEVDTKNSTFKLKWDSLLLGYENERIYIKFGNVKYYLDQADLMDVLLDITSQLGLKLPSMEELMSPETLDELMKNVQMLNVDGQTKIVFKMDGIEALIILTEDMKFVNARIVLDIDGYKADLTAKQADTQDFEAFDHTYQNIRPVLDFSQPIINLINARTYAFTFSLDMVGENNLSQTAQVRVSRNDNQIASCQIDSNIEGKWLHIRIVGDTTYLTYGDLKFKFSTTDFTEISEELQRLMPEGGLDLTGIVPQAYLDLFTKLDLNAIAGSIQSMELTDDNLSVKLKIGDDVITMNVGRVGGQLSGAHLSGATLLDSKVSVHAKMTAVSNYPSVIPVNPLGYTDLKGLAGFIGPVMDLVNANTYEFDVNLGMKGDLNLDHSAHVKLVRNGSEISAQVTTQFFGHNLDLRLVSGTTYVQYGNLKVKLDTQDLDEIIQQLKEILPEGSMDIDLAKILPQSYLEVFDRDVFQWLNSIKRVQITDTKAALAIQIGDDEITLSVSRNADSITGARVQGATVLGSKVDVSVVATAISQAKQAITVDPTGYVDAKDLLSFINPVMDLVDGVRYDMDLSASLTGKVNWAQDAKLKVVRTASGANLELTAQVSGLPVSLKYIGTTAYLQSGNIKVKLNTTDIDEITKQLQAILPEGALEVDLSEILPQSYLDLFTELDIHKLVQSIQELTLNGETITLKLKIGDDVITITLTKNGSAIQSASIDGVTVMETKVKAVARLNSVSKQADAISINAAAFTDIKELTAFVPDVSALLNAKSYEIEAVVKLSGKLALETTANIKIVRTAEGVNLEAAAMLGGEELSLRFVDQVAYLRYGNLKLKLDTQDLDEITEAVRQIVPEEWMDLDLAKLIPAQYLEILENPDIPALLRDIQSFSAKDGKLNLAVKLGDEVVSVGVVRTAQGIQSVSLSGKEYFFQAFLKSYSNTEWAISKDEEGYVNGKDLLPFLKPIVNAIQATSYELDLELTLLDSRQNTTLSVPGHLALERTDDGVNLALTAEVLGEELNVRLIDSIAYLSYGELNVKLNTNDMEEIMDAVQDLLPKNFSLDLSKILPQAYLQLLEHPTPVAILGALRSVELENNLLTVSGKIGSDTIRVRLATDGETLTYAGIGGISVGKQTLYLTLRDLQLHKERLNLTADNQDYLDAKDLVDFLKPILDLIDGKSWKFAVAVELNGETYSLDVQLSLDKKNVVDFAVTSDDFGGEPLTVKHVGNTTYLNYANIKLLLKDADLNTILKKLQEILPENLDLSGLLDLDSFQSLSDLDLTSLLGGVRGLSLDGDTLTVTCQLGDDTVELILINGKKYPESLSVSGLLGGNFGLTADQLEVDSKVSLAKPEDASEYVDALDLIECLEPVLYILESTDCTMNLKVMDQYGIEIRKVKTKIYMTYVNNPAFRVIMNVDDTTTLIDLIDQVMKLVDVIETVESSSLLYSSRASLEAGGISIATQEEQELIQALLEEAESRSISLDTSELFSILQSMVIHPIENRMATIELTVNGETIVVQTGRYQNNPKLAHLLVLGEDTTYAELKVTKIQLPSGSVGGKPEETPDDDDYVDLGQLGSFIKPITNLLEAKGYQFDVTVKADSLMETTNAWDQTLHVDINRGDGNAVSAQVTATLFEKDLTLTYLDDTIYLKFGDAIKLQLKATEESELIAKLKELFADENSGTAPDLDYSAFLPQSYLDFIQEILPSDGEVDQQELIDNILSRVTAFSVKGQTAKLSFQISDEDILEASVVRNKAGDQFTNVTLEGLKLLDSEVGVSVDITNISKNPIDIALPGESGSFSDLDKLTGFIDPIINLLEAKYYAFDVQVAMSSLSEEITDTWDQTLHVALSRSEADAIRAQVTANLFNKDMTLTYVDDTVYLEFGAVRLKLNVTEESELITKIQELLAAENGGQVPEMDYTAFIPQSYLDFVQEVLPKDGVVDEQALIESILSRLTKFEVQDDQVSLSLMISKDNLVTASAVRQGDQFSSVSLEGLQILKNADGTYSDTDVTLNVTEISSTAKEIAVPETDDKPFFDLNELAGFLDPIQALIEAKSYEFDVALKSEKIDADSKLDLDQTAHVGLVRRDDGKVDAQVTLDSFLGASLTLTYLNDGDDAKIYVQYGDDVKMFVSQKDIQNLSDDLTKFLYDLGLQSKEKSGGESFTKEQIKEIVLQLLPQDYAIFFEDTLSINTIGTVLGGIENLELIREADGAQTFQVAIKLGEQETITASVTRKETGSGDMLSKLSVGGVTLLGSKTSVEVSEVAISNDGTALTQAMADRVQGFTDLFGGVVGENSQGVIIDALTNMLKKNPLQITFGVTETDRGSTISHNATAFVDSTTAYATYRSNQGTKDMKLKVDYSTVNELLPSVLYLLDIDINQYPALEKLAGSFGIDPSKAIPSDVLSSLFDGLLGNLGAFEANELTENLDFADAIKNIIWKGNEIKIVLDSKELYGENATQQDLTVKLVKTDSETTVTLENIHGSDTKTLNLSIVLKNVTQAQIPSGDSSYMDFTSLDQFYADLVNTASFKEYHLAGNVKLNLALGSINLTDVIVPVNLKITLGDDNQLKQIYAKLDVDYGTTMMSASVFADPSYSYGQTSSGNFFSGKKKEYRREFKKVEVFYNPTGGNAENTIYFRRTYEEYQREIKTVMGIESGNWYDISGRSNVAEYVSLNFDDMQKASDPTMFVMNYVYYCLPFSRDFTFLGLDLQGIINDQIKNKTEVSEKPVIENILNQFNFANNKYFLDVNSKVLIQDGRFSDSLTLGFTRSSVSGSNLVSETGGTPHVLSQFDVHADIVPVGSGYLVDLVWSPTLANYNGTTVTKLTNGNGLLPETLNSLADLGENKTSDLGK